MATKKNEKAMLEEFQLQQLAGLGIIKEMLLQVFPDSAPATAEQVTRAIEWLAFEDNGDPAEDQSELLEALKNSKVQAIELFGLGVSVEGVLDVHEVIYQDFYADDEDDNE